MGRVKSQLVSKSSITTSQISLQLYIVAVIYAGIYIATLTAMTTLIRVSDVLSAVKALGLTCRYDSAYQEFRINYKRSDSRWSEDSAYFTTYRDDAIATAGVMARHGSERIKETND